MAYNLLDEAKKKYGVRPLDYKIVDGQVFYKFDQNNLPKKFTQADDNMIRRIDSLDKIGAKENTRTITGNNIIDSIHNSSFIQGAAKNYFQYGASINKALAKITPDSWGFKDGQKYWDRESKMADANMKSHGWGLAGEIVGDPINLLPAGLLTKAGKAETASINAMGGLANQSRFAKHGTAFNTLAVKAPRIGASIAGGSAIGAGTMVAKNYGDDSMTLKQKSDEILLGALFGGVLNGAITPFTKATSLYDPNAVNPIMQKLFGNKNPSAPLSSTTANTNSVASGIGANPQAFGLSQGWTQQPQAGMANNLSPTGFQGVRVEKAGRQPQPNYTPNFKMVPQNPPVPYQGQQPFYPPISQGQQTQPFIDVPYYQNNPYPKVDARYRFEFPNGAPQQNGYTTNFQMIGEQAQLPQSPQWYSHPRLNELLSMRENVSASDAKNKQNLVSPRMPINGDGYQQKWIGATYEDNYLYDFELTKRDVANIRAGKITPEIERKIITDLSTLDNDPKYSPLGYGENTIYDSIPYEEYIYSDGYSDGFYGYSDGFYSSPVLNNIMSTGAGAVSGTQVDYNQDGTINQDDIMIGAIGGATGHIGASAMMNRGRVGSIMHSRGGEYNPNRNGLFAGERAKGFSKAEADGNIHYGKYDDMARFEIDDSVAKLKPLDPNKTSYTLNDVIDHPKLFDNYPQFKDTKVEFINEADGTKGYYDPKTNTIGIQSGASKKEILSTLLHETQHGIQVVEGFARGGNIDEAYRELNKRIYDLEQKGFLDEHIAQKYASEIEKLKTNKVHEALKLYERIAGEIEARDVQARQYLTAQERSTIEPYSNSKTYSDDIRKQSEKIENYKNAQEWIDYKEGRVRFEDLNFNNMAELNGYPRLNQAQYEAKMRLNESKDPAYQLDYDQLQSKIDIEKAKMNNNYERSRVAYNAMNDGRLTNHNSTGIDPKEAMVRFDNSRGDLFIPSKEDDSYRISHRAPYPSGANTGDNLEDVYPDDIYSAKGAMYYGHGDTKMDNESIKVIRAMRGNPNAKVTIYRAVPKNVDAIYSGDWVTISKTYAKQHGESWVENGDYKIISKDVTAKEIATDGDSIHEWGYHPEESIMPYPKGSHSSIYDNGVRQWVDDSESSIKTDNLTHYDNGVLTASGRLEDVLDHEKLYDQYPQAKDIEVDFEIRPNGEPYGEFSVERNKLHVIGRSEEEARSTLLHEVQHYIQNESGWATGGSPQKYGYDIYKNLHGEQEARAVQSALNHPDKTPYEALRMNEGELPQPIVKFDNGIMMSIDEATKISDIPWDKLSKKEASKIVRILKAIPNNDGIFKPNTIIRTNEGDVKVTDLFARKEIEKHLDDPNLRGMVTTEEVASFPKVGKNIEATNERQGLTWNAKTNDNHDIVYGSGSFDGAEQLKTVHTKTERGERGQPHQEFNDRNFHNSVSDESMNQSPLKENEEFLHTDSNMRGGFISNPFSGAKNYDHLKKLVSDEASKDWGEISSLLKRSFTNTLSKEYMDVRDKAHLSDTHVAQKMERLHYALSQLDDETQTALHDYIAGDSKVAPKGMEQLADSIKGEIDSISKQLVESGVLTQNAYDEWAGKYIHRSYDKYFFKEVKDMLGRGFKIDEIIERGKSEILSLEQFNKKMEAGVISEELQKLPLSDGGIRVKKLPNGKIKVRRDWTKEERKAMGEITKASITIPETIARLKIMLNHANMLKEIESVSGAVLPIEQTAKLSSDELKQFGYVMLPKSERYGVLSGRAVRIDVANDIKGMHDTMFREIQGVDGKSIKGWLAYLSLWKKAHTVWNAPSHVNNFLSNAFLMHLAGVDSISIVKELGKAGMAIKDGAKVEDMLRRSMIGKATPEELSLLTDMKDTLKYYEEAKINGLFSRSQLNDILRGKQQGQRRSMLGKVDKFTEDAYQFEDHINRLAMFTHMRTKGKMNIEEAISAVNTIIPDYSKPMPPAIRALRDSGISPFISWTYYTVPNMFRLMKTKQGSIQIAKALGALGMFSYMASGISPLESIDLPFIKEPWRSGSVPDDMAGRRIPVRKSGDTVDTLKIDKFIPYLEPIISPKNFAISHLGGITPNLLVNALSSSNGGMRDIYNNRPVTRSSKSIGDQTYDHVKHAITQYAPVPSSAVTGYNILESIVREKKKRQNDDTLKARSTGQELLKMIGFNTMSYSQKNAQKEFNK